MKLPLVGLCTAGKRKKKIYFDCLKAVHEIKEPNDLVLKFENKCINEYALFNNEKNTDKNISCVI